MVAPNTQVSPLQHHSKSSNTLKSFKNYSRILSEVQKEGFEVHKENFLSLSLSKKDEHIGAGERLVDPSTPFRSHVGHLHPHGASSKTVLPSVSSAEMGTSPHGHVTGQHEQYTVYTEPGVLHETSRSHAPGIAGKPSPALGEEANNAFKLYSEMFPRTCTSMNACMTTCSMHVPPEPMMGKHVPVVQFSDALCQPQVLVGIVEHHGDGDQSHNLKRLKYNSMVEDDDTSIRQISEQGITSCCVVDGHSMCASRDVASHASISDFCSFNCAATTNDCMATMAPLHHAHEFSLEVNASQVSGDNAYSACTSHTVELSKAPAVIGLKLFTTSAHAHMPMALLTFSEGEPSLPLSLEHSQQETSTKMQKTPMHDDSCTDTDWGKFLALSATPVANNADTTSARVLPFQQRFKQLQAFLKQCDEADQNECMQALRSLSAAARSGHAVELETRAIRLSLEEGKEMKRMRLLNVLGKISERSLDDAGATPHGPRLPAPGAISKLKGVP